MLSHHVGGNMSRKNSQFTIAIIGSFVIICILSYYSWTLSSESRTLKRLVVTTYSKLKDMTTHKNAMEKKNTLLSNRMVEMEERMSSEKQNAETEQKQRSRCATEMADLKADYKGAEERVKKCEGSSLQREKNLLDLLKDVNLDHLSSEADQDVFVAKIKHLKELLKTTGADYQKLQDKYSELEKDKIKLAEDCAKLRNDMQKCKESHSLLLKRDAKNKLDGSNKAKKAEKNKEQSKSKNKGTPESEEKAAVKESFGKRQKKLTGETKLKIDKSRKLKASRKETENRTKTPEEVESNDSKLATTSSPSSVKTNPSASQNGPSTQSNVSAMELPEVDKTEAKNKEKTMGSDDETNSDVAMSQVDDGVKKEPLVDNERKLHDSARENGEEKDSDGSIKREEDKINKVIPDDKALVEDVIRKKFGNIGLEQTENGEVEEKDSATPALPDEEPEEMKGAGADQHLQSFPLQSEDGEKEKNEEKNPSDPFHTVVEGSKTHEEQTKNTGSAHDDKTEVKKNSNPE